MGLVPMLTFLCASFTISVFQKQNVKEEEIDIDRWRERERGGGGGGYDSCNVNSTVDYIFEWETCQFYSESCF